MRSKYILIMTCCSMILLFFFQACKTKKSAQAIITFSEGKTGYFLIKINEKNCANEKSNVIKKSYNYYFYFSNSDSVICTAMNFNKFDTISFILLKLNQDGNLDALKAGHYDYQFIKEVNRTYVVGYHGKEKKFILDSNSIAPILREAYINNE